MAFTTQTRETIQNPGRAPRNGPLKEALEQLNGARFYKCALQVNPYSYLERHAKQLEYKNEEQYNGAMIEACLANNVEVIAITDHYRVKSGAKLRESAKKAGIYVFPGFEAVTTDGVHLLCLFDVDRDEQSIERILGACGIHNEADPSPLGSHDVVRFFEECPSWGAVAIAAHVASDGGLLKKLSGKSRVRAWQDPNVLVVALPGSVGDAPDNIQGILQNVNADYRRDRAATVVNAQDVQSPQDLTKPGAATWIKMAEVSLEGLRQAFLDPKSRIRLSSDPSPEPHNELVAIAWEGGFLDGAVIHFNENLNVLIGGRGTGKSTVLESIRYVLGISPLGEEATRAHQGIVRDVLRSGTKISLLIRSHHPSSREYVIERTIPNPPIVRDANGMVLDLMPSNVAGGLQVFGQHEIAELSKSPEKLTRILERFVAWDDSLADKKRALALSLQQSRQTLLQAKKELEQIAEQLSLLPGLEETLKRFQAAGLEQKLREKSLLVREERVLATATERIQPAKQLVSELRDAGQIDRAFVSAKALQELPGRFILEGIHDSLRKLGLEVSELATRLSTAISSAEKRLEEVRSEWKERQKTVNDEYDKLLRELQKTRVDGDEFIRLRKRIEDLRPLEERKALVTRLYDEEWTRRRALLAEWEDLKAGEFRLVERAAQRVNRGLAGRVQVAVRFAGDRERLCNLLRDEVGGRLGEAVVRMQELDDMSLTLLADSCRQGTGALQANFGLSPSQARRIAESGEDVFMRIEELDLPPTTSIQLNTAAQGDSPVWQPLGRLSTGQKATAVLLLLLLDSDSPLLVDQPEDDLDNRFITDGVVPKMRDEKRRRQFLFSTHNANIPVLGDAELILGLVANAGENNGTGRLPVSLRGSIDTAAVREMVEEVLEGGRAAFKMRRLKYGF